MVKLTRIYTKVGDDGRTMLGDGSMEEKNCPRVEAYGAVDEANAAIGVATSKVGEAGGDHAAAVGDLLLRVQNDLFDVGADLCVPVAGEESDDDPKLRITQPQVDRLERAIDEFNADLGTLDSFILPGGRPAAADLHVARTVVRRAERRVKTLIDREPDRVNKLAMVYLNRLGDLLFVLARTMNDRGKGDVLWTPGKHREKED